MQLPFACLLLLAVASCVHAEAQYNSQYNPFIFPVQQPNYFRAGIPRPSYDAQVPTDAARLFLGSITLTVATQTVTTTLSLTFTCTTTTAAISYCTASGRRRRGVPIPKNKEGRGLFYNEEEVEGDDGSIFLPSPITEDEPSETKEVSRNTRETVSAVPYIVQPGFENSVGPSGRIFINYATSTTTSTITTSITTSLTAICSSTTGFVVCGTSG